MDYDDLKASDGTGNAALATVQSARSIGGTILDVDTVDNWPTNFIAVVGTLKASGFLDPATITEFQGHLNGGDIEIDAFEPGHTDNGNAADQVVVIKPTTGWPNYMVQLAKVTHNADGTLKDDIVTTAKIINEAEITNPKDVKLVTDVNDFALYFSRATIPHGRDYWDHDSFKHLGVYAYTKRFVDIFNALPMGKLEDIEKLEQLRALEYGHKIKVVQSQFDSPEVDLPGDIAIMEALLQAGH